jgi:diaminopimelate decarboxylase
MSMPSTPRLDTDSMLDRHGESDRLRSATVVAIASASDKGQSLVQSRYLHIIRHFKNDIGGKKGYLMSTPVTSEPVSPDNRTTLELNAVLPLTAEVHDGHLHIGGVDMVELARTQGTALYVMDERHIRMQLSTYRVEMNAHGVAADVAYASKAFTSVAMCRLVAEEGCCLDVSSGGELAIAQAADFPMEHVVVHGNDKTPCELTEAITARVGLIVADSIEELDRIDAIATGQGVRQRVLLRVTPGVHADTHSFIQTGQEDSKFGFSAHSGAALDATVHALSLPGVDLSGFHMHIGSQIFSLDSFVHAVEIMVDFMARVREKTGFIVRDFDCGGGLGIAYRPTDEPSTIACYADVLIDAIKRQCAAHGLPIPHVYAEPGRSIVADAGVTLYTVGSIKHLPGIRTYVAVDGGMTDNIRPALYGAVYEATVANRASEPRTTIVALAGKHCESGDILIHDASLQPVEDGDIICIFSTGAYCQTMSSNYNKQVRPGVVFVSDGKVRQVVRRETYDDLLRYEVY